MSYCPFCGREMVNGRCDCSDYQAYIAGMGGSEETEKTKKTNAQERTEGFQSQRDREPFLINPSHYDFSSLSAFISSVRGQFDVSGDHEKPKGDAYERDIPIAPGCIELEKDEIPVKQYNLCRMRSRIKFMSAEGRLMVTNRRILFRATGKSRTGNIIEQQQFELDQIGGVDIHKDYRYSGANLFGCILLLGPALVIAAGFLEVFINSTVAEVIVGLILGILGCAPTFVVFRRPLLKYFCATIGFFALFMVVVMFYSNAFLILLMIAVLLVCIIDLMTLVYVPNFVMAIQSKGGIGAFAIIHKDKKARTEAGDSYSGFNEILPWEDTDMAIDELGTIIADLQRHGDYAIEKWTTFQ